MQVRLSTIYDEVDFFLISESTTSFQNRPKPLYYKENEQRFARFKDKIIHLPIEILPGQSSYYRSATLKLFKAS